MSNKSRQTFYKLVFGSFRSAPQKQLRIFYNGIPLHVQARFEGDRYVFALPVNLAEKLMAGNLIADFSFSEFGDQISTTRKLSTSPTSIVLSERYS